MLCQKCKKQESTVFLKVAVNNKITEMHLCNICAFEKGIGLNINTSNLPITDMFSNVSEFVKEFLPKEKKGLYCTSCGLKYSDFKEDGKLGCSDCYRNFEPQLTELLTRIHGNYLHTGKKYVEKEQKISKMETKRIMEDLKKDLKEAIDREDFETAANLRDKIKELESSNEF
jgi:protein arginine kinase activator